MRLSALFATTLISVASPALATEWTTLSNEGKADVYYAADRLNNFDGYATGWMRQDYREPQPNNHGQMVDRANVRYVFNCAKGTAGIMQAEILYRGKMLNMIAQPYETARNDQEGVAANSHLQRIMNLACARPTTPLPPGGVAAEQLD